MSAFVDDEQARTVMRYVRRGETLDTIAMALDTDIWTVARRLRRAGVLEPYDDPRALVHLYHDHGYSVADLAGLFGEARGPDSLRRRMDAYGIDRRQRSLADVIGDPSVGPEAIGLESRGRSG